MTVNSFGKLDSPLSKKGRLTHGQVMRERVETGWKFKKDDPVVISGLQHGIVEEDPIDGNVRVRVSKNGGLSNRVIQVSASVLTHQKDKK